MIRYFATDADEDEPALDSAGLEPLLAGADERRRVAASRPGNVERLRRRLLDWQPTG